MGTTANNSARVTRVVATASGEHWFHVEPSDGRGYYRVRVGGVFTRYGASPWDQYYKTKEGSGDDIEVIRHKDLRQGPMCDPVENPDNKCGFWLVENMDWPYESLNEKDEEDRTKWENSWLV